MLRGELAELKAQRRFVDPQDYVFATSRGGRPSADNLRNRVLGPEIARADAALAGDGHPPLPVGLSPHKLRHTFASLLATLGEAGYIMDQLGHTNPAFTFRVYRHTMRRDDEERERLRALVSGADWARVGTGGHRGGVAVQEVGAEKALDSRDFGEADEGTRTLDLLHGKQTL